MVARSLFALGIGLGMASMAMAQDCVERHREVTPGIVTDWEISAHHAEDVDRATCHGDGHQSADDVANVSIPTPDTCAECHEKQVTQFSKGKHAFAWAAVKAMSTAHWQPMELMSGMKGCGGCHKLGLKSEEEIKERKKTSAGFGVASCDACHTRHTFSLEEARQPQACQTCHMPDGDHEVGTAWASWPCACPCPRIHSGRPIGPPSSRGSGCSIRTATPPLDSRW
jgi:hypothetical protein